MCFGVEEASSSTPGAKARGCVRRFDVRAMILPSVPGLITVLVQLSAGHGRGATREDHDRSARIRTDQDRLAGAGVVDGWRGVPGKSSPLAGATQQLASPSLF